MKSSWDRYLKEQMKDLVVRQAFEEESGVLNVGLALAAERKRRGLTQEQAARRVGTSAPQLSRTERRPERANLTTLIRYAAALEMDLAFRLVPKRAGLAAGARKASRVRGGGVD